MTSRIQLRIMGLLQAGHLRLTGESNICNLLFFGSPDQVGG
jgi:hypothetical protein